MPRSPDRKLSFVAGAGLLVAAACGFPGRPEAVVTTVPASPATAESPVLEPCNQLPRAHSLVENCLKLLNYLATEPINAERTLAELGRSSFFKYRPLVLGTQPHDFYLTDEISPDNPLSSRRLPITYEPTRYPRNEGYFNFGRGSVVALSTALGVYTESDYGPVWLNQIIWAVTIRDDSRWQFNAVAERDIYNRFSPEYRQVRSYVYLRSNTYTPQFPFPADTPSSKS